MTAQILFNQFAYTDRLARGGFTPEQARASAEALEAAFSDVVATKSDIAELRSELKADIAELRSELKADIAEVKVDIVALRAEVKADIAELRGEIALVETRLELKIAQAKNDTIKWIFTFNLALVGAIFAIVKFGQ